MALVQRDYILRLIERIAAVLARVMKRKSEGDAVGARGELRQAYGEVLGPAGAMAQMADSRTAANLVGDARRIHLWCRLLREEAILLREQGASEQASAIDRRIVELLLEAWPREREWDEETLDVFRESRTQLGDAALDRRYRDALTTWDAEQR